MLLHPDGRNSHLGIGLASRPKRSRHAHQGTKSAVLLPADRARRLADYLIDRPPPASSSSFATPAHWLSLYLLAATRAALLAPIE